jgi:lipopolysaccharide/colanic/teichoic acid biosynthesis glycosyltransferase
MSKNAKAVYPRTKPPLVQQSSPGSVSGFSRSAARRTRSLDEDTFLAILGLERRRAERSRKPFVLMLLDMGGLLRRENSRQALNQTTSAVAAATRETDFVGWYKQDSVLGIVFVEVNDWEDTPIAQLLLDKVVRALHAHMDPQAVSKIVISAHLFPESASTGGSDFLADETLYPDIAPRNQPRKPSLIVKRLIDVAASALLLLSLSPLFAVIAVAIKLGSEGPVFFAQERMGQFGSRFKCIKFRTMYINNDPKIHREYVEQFIAGKANAANNGNGSVVYKITDDPRVTTAGKLLRRLSLDELPQFWNVLRGDMSLVGPRPPLPYEFRVYDIWHRRRVLELRPGVTGLWQVSGRSRTSFDDMVRLDLRYSQSWSLWLDLKILAATPKAVFTGDGAY